MQDRDQPDTEAQAARDGVRAASIGREAGMEQRVPNDTPMVDAAQLFGRHRQVVIGHNGCRYVLRIAKHGKLILNK
jgi:hemin uptake protein HemP